MTGTQKRSQAATRKARKLMEFLQFKDRPAIKNFQKVARMYGVHHVYGTVLKDMGYLTKENGNYVWLGGKITKDLVEEVKERVHVLTNSEFYL